MPRGQSQARPVAGYPSLRMALEEMADGLRSARELAAELGTTESSVRGTCSRWGLPLSLPSRGTCALTLQLDRPLAQALRGLACDLGLPDGSAHDMARQLLAILTSEPVLARNLLDDSVDDSGEGGQP